MRRTTSTALTRGKITRIISRTTAVFKCYEIATKELVNLSVTFDCKVPEERVIVRAIKDGYIDTNEYKVLDVESCEITGALYAMDVATFIENAEVIEEGITD